MRFAGYQPHYFPRLHYFNRMLDADIFGIGDYLQFVRKHAYILPDGSRKSGKSYQAHTPIKHGHGEYLLSLPAREKLLPLNQTGIDYSRDWVAKHLINIAVNYGKAPYFPRFFPEIEALLARHYTNLAELNTQTMFWGITRLLSDDGLQASDLTIKNVNDLLGTKHPFRLKRIFLDSQSPVPHTEKGKANEWLIALCQYAHADEYVCGGTGHTAYMDVSLFAKAGIKTVIQDWPCPLYSQQFPRLGFLQNLSIIDLIMNEDLEKRQRVILGE